MKNKFNPAEFLGVKVLSPIDQSRIKGGARMHQQQINGGQGQQIIYDGQGQQQQIQNIF